jgi:hypothetical protein
LQQKPYKDICGGRQVEKKGEEQKYGEDTCSREKNEIRSDHAGNSAGGKSSNINPSREILGRLWANWPKAVTKNDFRHGWQKLA